MTHEHSPPPPLLPSHSHKIHGTGERDIFPALLKARHSHFQSFFFCSVISAPWWLTWGLCRRLKPAWSSPPAAMVLPIWWLFQLKYDWTYMITFSVIELQWRQVISPYNRLQASILSNEQPVVYLYGGMITPTQRSSQVLRVCRSMYHEAYPRLYANTTFYLHGGTHLASLSRHVDRHKVRIILLRMMVSKSSDRLDREPILQALLLDGVTFPNLKSLEIKIGLRGPEDTNPDHFSRLDARRFRREILSSILGIQMSHNHLCRLLESGTPTGTGLAFRLVTASAANRENVKFQINRPEFSPADKA